MQTINESKIKYIYISTLVITALIAIITEVWCTLDNIVSMEAAGIRDVSAERVALFICVILIFSIANDKPWDRQNRSLMRLVCTLEMLLFISIAEWMMTGNTAMIPELKAADTLMYFNETLLDYCFWIYIREELKHEDRVTQILNNICRTALILDVVLDLINLKYGFFFVIDESAQYVSGKYEMFSSIITSVICIACWVAIIAEKKRSVKEKLMLMTFLVFPVIANFAGMTTDNYALLFPTYLFSLMIIYINVFATRGKKILEQQAELDRQSTALMISQIQPHFLYNVLTTISNLCVTDPEEAEETTVLFSQYLRTNLDSLRKPEPVEFAAELRHIKTYVELEKKRFKEKLNVTYDCCEAGFPVPSLGLQPIVENSIKHGIRGKDTPGHLSISSSRVEGGYEVVIEDDGVGFDPSAPAKNDGRSHVGMQNVRSRLEKMCGATMEVITSPGNGCRTTIFFPEANGKH